MYVNQSLRLKKIVASLTLGLLTAHVGYASSIPDAWDRRTSSGAEQPRLGQSATLLQTGQWLVTGGTAGSASSQVTVLNASGVSAKSDATLQLEEPRSGHSATVLPNGSILVFGGQGSDGRLLGTAELIDLDKGPVNAVTDPGLIPRRGHTATLLTNGMVLIAGGVDADGTPVVEAELWDPEARTISPFIAPLVVPRSEHNAALLASGKGLLWHGKDSLGQTVSQGELYDPATKIFSAVEWWDDVALGPANANSLSVEEVLPAEDAGGVPVDTRVAIRFSLPIDVKTGSRDTVTVIGPSGAVDGKVVVAEAGRLVFFTPSAELWPGSTYTLFLKGIKSTAGTELPFFAASFSTATLETQERGVASSSHDRTAGMRGSISVVRSQKTVSPPNVGVLPNQKKRSVRDKTSDREDEEEADDEEQEDWIPGPEHRRGNWRMLTGGSTAPLKIHRDVVAPLSAPIGVTAVAGRVLKLNGKPLAGVSISSGSVASVTDASGRFLLANVPAGSQQMLVNAEGVTSAGRHYGRHYIRVRAEKGKTTLLPREIYLSRVNPAHEITIPSPMDREMIATHPLIPGLEIRFPKGTIIRDANGRIVTKLNLTPVPIDRAPSEVPDIFPVYFTMQPAGAIIENKDPTVLRSFRVHYPNYSGIPASQVVDFYSYDSTEKGWYVYGKGRVSNDGKQASPDPGVGEYALMPFGFGIGPNGDPPPEGPPPGGCDTAGDPVDCATGLFLHSSTDFFIQDVIPLALNRVYRQNDVVSRDFGIGSTHNYSMYLYSPEPETESPAEVDLVLPDGGRVRYTQTGTVTWRHTTTPTIFNGSELSRNREADRYEIALRDGSKLFFGDHSPNLFLGMQDPNGNTVIVARPSDNAPITTITSSNGRYLSFTYDTNRRITKITDNMGRSVDYEYDTSGRLWKVTDQANKIEEYSYDANHRMETVVDRRGNRMVLNEYDPTTGRVKKQTLADDAVWQFDYVLNDAGKVTQTKITNPRGYIREATFNAAGYLVREVLAKGETEQQIISYERDPRNLITAIVDALNRRTEFSYDPQGRLLSVTNLYGTADAITRVYTYDQSHGRLTSYTDPLGHVYKLGYDAKGNLISATDPLNHTKRLTVNGQGLPTDFYNALNRRWTMTYAQADIASVADPLGRKATFYTDSVGRIMTVLDPLSNRTQYVYDKRDNVLQLIDAAAGVTTVTYDELGHVLTVRDPRNLASHTYTYDKRNRFWTYTDPLGRAETRLYNGMGNLETYTDRKSQVTRYIYDPLNRLKTITFHDGHTIQVTWDAGNRARVIVDSLNGTITRDYDDMDRLTLEKGGAGEVVYEYDDDGRRSSMTVAGGTPAIYDYDNADRLKSITRGTEAVAFDYDNADRRSSLTLPNGVVTTYGYTIADDLKSLTFSKGTETLGLISYTYDGAGRRISRSSDLDNSGIPTPVSLATYDAANKLTQWGSQILTYDLNGNLSGEGTKVYTWNVRNQLSAITGNGGFAYDAVGRRRSRNVGGVTTRYQYDGLNILRELNGTIQTASYFTGLGLDEVFSRTDSAGTSAYLNDALNSVVALTDVAGVKKTSYGYDAYGNTSTSGAANGNKLQYTGRENDGTGLYYMRARYYSPTLHRFVSSDPIGLRGGINTYAYVGGDPVSNIDPLGLDNIAKGLVGTANVGRSIGLAIQGRTMTLVAVVTAGLGQPELAVPSAAIAAWKFNSSATALEMGFQQLVESQRECESHWKNALGLLPFGTKFDDPGEPLPWEADLFKGESISSIIGNLGLLLP